jgi:hypothetical protein
LKEMQLDVDTKEIIRDISASDLRSIEKVVLTLEWILRERLPAEMEDSNLQDLAGKAKLFIKTQVSMREYEDALEEARVIFKTSSDPESFNCLLAISYYSYIDDEYLYDQRMRKILLDKTAEVGIKPSRVAVLYRRWNRMTGGSEDLFNRIAGVSRHVK